MCLTSMDHVTSMLTTTTTTDHASTCTFPLQACNRIPQRWMLARAAGLPLVSAFTGLSLTFALFSSQIPQQPCRSASESIAAAYCSAQQPMSVPKIQLADGREIPQVGLGVYKARPGETYSAVLSALKLGYRHIDTAAIYGNEADVGRAVKDSGIPREEIWVTTKLWRDDWGYERATKGIQASLQRLGLEYVDLILLHSPGPAGEARQGAWRAIEEAVQQGTVKSAGVSNFNIGHLEKLLSHAEIKPVINQIELSPFLQWRELVAYCKDKNIALEAYSPLCKAEKLDDPRLVALANQLGVSTARLLLRWSIQKGFIPLPKSVNPERQAQNIDVYSFSLSPEVMDQLDALEEGLITGWTPILTDPI